MYCMVLEEYNPPLVSLYKSFSLLFSCSLSSLHLPSVSSCLFLALSHSVPFPFSTFHFFINATTSFLDLTSSCPFPSHSTVPSCSLPLLPFPPFCLPSTAPSYFLKPLAPPPPSSPTPTPPLLHYCSTHNTSRGLGFVQSGAIISLHSLFIPEENSRQGIDHNRENGVVSVRMQEVRTAACIYLVKPAQLNYIAQSVDKVKKRESGMLWRGCKIFDLWIP